MKLRCVRKIWLFSLLCIATTAIIFPSSAHAAAPIDPEVILDKRIESYSIKGTFAQAVKQIEKMGHVQCNVDWPVMQAVGIKRKTRVSLIGKDVTFSQMIDLMLHQLKRRTKDRKPLAWVVRNNAILLTTQENILRRRTPPNFGSGRSGQTATTRPARLRSRRRGYEFNFQEAALAEVIDKFREITGANFHVHWRVLQAVDIDKYTEISFRAKEISVARALDLAVDQLNADKDKFDSIYWVLNRNVVEITTGEVLDSTMRTRVYEVGDLLHVAGNFPGTGIKTALIGQGKNVSFDSGKSGGDTRYEDKKNKRKSMRELRREKRQSLITIIKNAIGEEMWRPMGKGSIRLHNKKLIITQSLLGFKLMEKSLRK